MSSTNELKQGTPEWHAARVGRITASMVGAVLGVSPWRTRNAALKDMAAAAVGEDNRLTGPALEWGIENEEEAAKLYDFLYADAPVLETGLWVDNWKGVLVGASPDRLVGDVGLVEIKCPFSLRELKNPDGCFKDAKDQPHYYHQIQMQLAITGRQWCDLFQWTPNGSRCERIYPEEGWLDNHLPRLREFWDDYLALVDKIKVGGPREKMSVSAVWAAAAEEWQLAKHRADQASTDEKAARERLIALLDDAELDECSGGGIKVQKVMRNGAVDYKSIAEELVPELKGVLEDYRRAPSVSWRITEENDDERN